MNRPRIREHRNGPACSGSSRDGGRASAIDSTEIQEAVESWHPKPAEAVIAVAALARPATLDILPGSTLPQTLDLYAHELLNHVVDRDVGRHKAVDRQRGQTVHGGPEYVRGKDLILKVIGRDGEDSGTRAALNDLFQHSSGPRASRSGDHRSIAWTDIGERRTEHQPVERGVLQSKMDVGSTDHGDKRLRIVDSGDGAQHAVAQSFEADNGDGGQKILLLGKVIVGRLVAYPGASRHFPEREGPILLLCDQFERSVDQSATKIAVMIGLRVGAAIFFCKARSNDIDSDYILI
jgi:hypothetical protein